MPYTCLKALLKFAHVTNQYFINLNIIVRASLIRKKRLFWITDTKRDILFATLASSFKGRSRFAPTKGVRS